MNLFQALILGLIQGLTEFAPVSSSAHLVLVPWALRWPAPGLAFDTMVHWGTLAALLAYFWRDWLKILSGFLRSLTPSNLPDGRLASPESRLAWWLILGTLPAVVIGYAFEGFFESLFGNPAAVGAFLLLTALVLVVSEGLGRRIHTLDGLRLSDALLIGLAQAAAICPGLSRSGATIAAGLGCGLTREAAARFSFLLATPVILGAGVVQLLELGRSAQLEPMLGVLVVGFLSAAGAGYLCIKFLLAYLRQGRLYGFAAYCVLVGGTTLVVSALS